MSQTLKLPPMIPAFYHGFLHGLIMKPQTQSTRSTTKNKFCKPQGGGSGKELGTAIFRQPFKKHGNQKQTIESVISGPNLCIFPPLGCAITILFFFGFVCSKKEELQSEIAKTRPTHCRRIQHTKKHSQGFPVCFLSKKRTKRGTMSCSTLRSVLGLYGIVQLDEHLGKSFAASASKIL